MQKYNYMWCNRKYLVTSQGIPDRSRKYTQRQVDLVSGCMIRQDLAATILRSFYVRLELKDLYSS